jgi:DNA-binding SARP family transcriptional activator
MSDGLRPANSAPAAGEAVSGLEIRLFGPVQVQIGLHPLPRLRSRKGLWLLALLALRAGRPIDRDWLAGTLWPEDDATHARRSLRQSLHDLRLALGREGRRLTDRARATLRPDMDGAFVDVLAFDAAIARGDPESLEQAVQLYRGPLLEGCLEEWCLEERRCREEACAAALERLAKAAAERRDHAAAACYLRRAVGIDPYQEELQRALMAALSASGNATGALIVYHQFQALLARDAAAEPAEETTALFRRLRAQAYDPTQPGGPGPLAAVPDRFPGPNPRGNLPQPLSGFVGRERELRELDACLSSARLVTLTGPGGIGKTRLAIQAAAARVPEDAAGAWFVELAALTDASLVPQTVASVLGVRETPGCSLMATLQEWLGPRQLLLVLDNCEHLIDECARLAHTLLAGCPHLRVLATSRQALGLTGEIAWPVSPLSLPGVQAFRGSGVQSFGSDIDGSASDPLEPERLNAQDRVPAKRVDFAAPCASLPPKGGPPERPNARTPERPNA